MLYMDIGPARTAWGVILQVVRLCICCVLAWYGALYLVHTPGIGDLILNAVALEIVLQIDELIFAALGSWRLKRLVGATALPACVPSYAVLAPPVLGAFAFVAALNLLATSRTPAATRALRQSEGRALRRRARFHLRERRGRHRRVGAHARRAVDRLEDRNYPDGGGAHADLTMDNNMGWSFREFTVQTVLRQLGRDQFIGVDAAGNATCYERVRGTRIIQKPRWGATPSGARLLPRDEDAAALPVAAGGSTDRRNTAQQKQRSVEDAVVTWNPGCEDTLDMQFELDLQIRGASATRQTPAAGSVEAVL